MTLKRTAAVASVLALASGITVSAARASVALIDFEATPALSAGPSIYVAVPAPQTITTAAATFSGGVVLGDATFFPAISFATAPNVYGTADFGNGLARSLTIAVNPTFATTEVSFALFNGEVSNQSYTVSAFNGSSLVASQALPNIAPNFNSGYGLVDLNAAGGITSVTIAPTGTSSAWDFLIDTIAFNQNITTVVPPPVIQPPAPPAIVTLHGHRGSESEPLEVEFGDNPNDVRGSTVPAPTPEPASVAILSLAAPLLLKRSRRTRTLA